MRTEHIRAKARAHRAYRRIRKSECGGRKRKISDCGFKERKKFCDLGIERTGDGE
jgi:hypothetical protein